MASSLGMMDSRNFLMVWAAKGPRQPAKDTVSRELWQLWKIRDKCTFRGRLCYGIQYWETENGKNVAYHVPVAEVECKYPEQVKRWEDKYGNIWKLCYPDGNPWESDEEITSAGNSGRTGEEKAGRADSSGDEDGGASLIDDTNREHALKRPLDDSTQAARKPINSMECEGSHNEDDIEDSQMVDSTVEPDEDGGMGTEDEIQSPIAESPQEPRSGDSDAAGIDNEPLSIFVASQREFAAGDYDVVVDEYADTAPVIGEYENFSNQLIEAHELSLASLVMQALQLRNMPCGKWALKREADSNSYDALISHLVVMMLGADSLVLEHVVRGDLCEAAVSNPSLRTRLATLLQEGSKEKRPTIYAQYLVDKKGLSPTPKLLLEALEIAERYVNTKDGSDQDANREAYRIDGMIGNGRLTSNGDRRYIADGQEWVANRFIQNTRARVASLPFDEPLERPLAEVGYSSYPRDRLKAHKMHKSSNYLMNLLEAIFARHFKGEFSIQQYVVHELVYPTHAMYAEIIYSRLGLVYIDQGGGFSHHPAGISHSGADTLPDEYYENAQRVLYESDDYQTRKAEEIKKQRWLAALIDNVGNFDERVQDLNESRLQMEKRMEELRALEKEVKQQWDRLAEYSAPLKALMNYKADPQE